MNETAKIVLDARRQELLESKLGSLLRWQPPKIVRTVGPFDPQVFEVYDVARREVIDQCRERLCAYAEGEIGFLLARADEEPEGLRAGWQSFQEAQISRVNRTLPAWHAGGFGHPDHVADFEYWARMPKFTVEEVTCVSVGIEPADFSAPKFNDMAREDVTKMKPALRFLLRRHELLRRRFDPQNHNWNVRPKEFLDWVDQVAFDTHPVFLNLLRQYQGRDAAPPSSAGEGRAPDKREIDKIAQLFTAIAIDSYGYRPAQLKSPIPTEITEIAASMGLSVSTDTVLKYLRIGAKFLPEGWEPDNR